MWYTRDELARDNEVLHPQWGVLYKSGVYASKVLCLTPGDLQRVPQGLRGSRGFLTAVQKSAEGIVGERQARLVRHSGTERWSNR